MSGQRPVSGRRPVSAVARGPKGLADREAPGEDPTLTSWGERLPLAGEHRGGLADAESDAGYRWAAQAARGRDVLDVGSGPGHGAAVLLEAGARSVVGVDRDPAAVEAATRLYGAQARFLHAEPMALPLAPESFDLAVCLGALDDAPDPEAILLGLRRVLTGDGLLFVSLPTAVASDGPMGPPRGETPAETWRGILLESYRHVRFYRRRICIAAAIAPAERSGAVPLDEAHWLAGGAGEDRATLAVASNAALPDVRPLASMTDFRDLREYRATLAAWEERARLAEADGSAKHWELVAAREAQRRLRKRVHELEHRPLRMLWRVMRGGPARLGKGPPVRPSERGPEEWG